MMESLHVVFKLVPDMQQALMGLFAAQTGMFVLFALTIYLFITAFQTWAQLSSFPGPFLSSFSYVSMFQLRCSGNAHLQYEALSRQYGPLVRIGPNDLLCADPDHLRRMSSARSSYERSSWYKATRLDPYHDMMGSTLDKGAHMSLRTKLAPGYNGKDNPKLEEERDGQIRALISLIKREYLTQQCSEVIPVDFGRLADLYAHDARSVISFVKPLGLLERNEDVHGIIATAKLAVDMIQVFTDIPPLQKIFLSDLVLKLLGPKPTDTYGVGKLMGMARELVASRFAPDAKSQNDLLGSFLRHGLDRRSAESEVMFPIIAGSDTTANAIKMTVAYLAASSRVSSLLQQEISDAILEGKLSDPCTGEETSQLPYLQAVIWESLRVHPPFPGLIMKEVGPDGDTYNGKHIPAGTRIGHSTLAATHDASVFGTDADCFRPERWSEADDKTRAIMQRSAELVFGSGRWGCPGRRVALTELSKVLVQLFRRFNFRFLDDDTLASAEKRTFFKSGSMSLVITERDN